MNTMSQKQLELFVERAHDIFSFSFAQQVQQDGAVRLHLSQTAGENLRIELTEPSREAYAAFILVLRSFIADRDGISLLSLSPTGVAPGALESVANDPDVSEQWKRAYRSAWTAIEQFLMENPQHLQFPDVPTRKVLLETFLYGDFAHWTSDKRARLQQWRAAPFIYHCYKLEFAGILMELLGALQFLLHWSEEELKPATSRVDTTDAEQGQLDL